MSYLEQIEDLQHDVSELLKKIEQLEKQKQKVIALIKDGRFVEALKVLEDV